MLRTIAIDMGGSGGKAFEAIYDGSTLAVSEFARFSNDPVYLGGAYCWDLPRLVHDAKQCLKQALTGQSAASFAIDTWGASMGMLDAGGHLLMLARHYRDREYEGIAQKAFKHIPRQEFFTRMGCSTEDNIALFQCYAQRLYAPEGFAAVRHVLLTADLIRFFLTDTLASEETLAGTGGLVEPYTRRRNDRDLRALGLPEALFPQPVRAGSLAGQLSRRVAQELGVDRVQAVAVAGHDTASAVLTLAQGAEDAFLILGTWGLMGVVTDRLIVTEAAQRRNCVNELSPEGKLRFLRNTPGLWIYDQCCKQWGVDHAQIIQQAQAAPAFFAWIDVEDPLFHPAGDMPGRICTYCRATKQPIPQSMGEMARCVFESMALKYRQALMGIQADTGRRISVIHTVGGGVKNQLLTQMIADATGCALHIGGYEASAVGNALMQLVALGELADCAQGRDLVARSFPATDVLPENGADWADAYGRFRAITDGSGTAPP